MVNLLLKLLLCPGAVFLADALSPVIGYSSSWHIIYIGFFIGIVGYMLDALLLKRTGSGVSAVADIVVAAIVVYFSKYFFTGVYMTVLGALLAGLVVGFGEYLLHRLIVDERHRSKEETAS